MSVNPLLLSIYLVPVVGILVGYAWRHGRREAASIRAAEEAIAASMTEPPSLHPVIDPTKCIGCKSCVAACPEQYAHPVLGMIRGKARLVGPSNCIGHGACQKACPADAITLVFGSERRGVDIPQVRPNFETNVPGIFIAGELGGMGLIRNAVEQGRKAMESVRALDGIGRFEGYDVVIVGAGPAGLAASLGAMQAGLRFVTIEQDSLGGTVAHFPRGKLVMTRPAELPVVGKTKFTETTKEKLLDFWRGVETKTGLGINYDERVEGIERCNDGRSFTVRTTRNSYATRAVLLCIGRRGTPRRLGVPGEELPKVVYRLLDPEQYRGQHVLVVGGGDSALEAACSIAGQPGTTVSLSYRSPAFTRAKPRNREQVEQMSAAGRLNVMLNSTVREIREDAVVIEQNGSATILPNNGVIVCAGGILPTGFLREIGIDVETKYGTA
jgi:thioredoxin reductase/NAD-dependent dihydropyrimidine dehydrogenase PreA subunit